MEMAFPVQNYNGGVCPQSHPKAIYSVLYQFFYNTEPYPEWQNWLYSMGDPTGYGLHGDFLQGWTNQTALEQAVYTCNGPEGFNAAPCSVAVPLSFPFCCLTQLRALTFAAFSMELRTLSLLSSHGTCFTDT